MFNPLETPWLLLILGIITLAAGSYIRNNVSPRNGLLLILAGLLLAGAAFGVDYLFQTDYEQLRGLIDTCKTAAVTNQPGLIGTCLSPQYRDSMHSDKDSMVADAQRIIKMAGISKIRFQSITFQVKDNTATAALNMGVFMDANKSAFAAGGLFFVEINVEFQKDNKRWLITSSEVVSVNNERAGWDIAH
jgi:hypothetical protein